MNNQTVIKQPIISEKVYTQMETGIYTFLVSKKSTKSEIKKAVEKQFKVTVLSVNISKKGSKKRRVTGTRKMVDTGTRKKAVVSLKAGDKISALSPKSESKKEKKEKKETKTGTSEQKEEKKGLLSRIKKDKKTDEKENK